MKMLYTFIKDMKVSFKTFYIYIEIIMALIFVAVLLFVVPENFSSSAKMYAYVDSSIKSEEIIEILEEESTENIVFLDSEDEIVSKLEEDRNSIGVGITFENNKIQYNVILQGYESERYRNIIENSLVANTAKDMPGYESITNIKTLDNTSERLYDRLNILLILLIL